MSEIIPEKPSKPRNTRKAAAKVNITAEITEAKVDTSDNVITGPVEQKVQPVSNLAPNENGAMTSRAATRAATPKPAKEPKEEEEKKIALWSEKNIYWEGIGRLTIGYNIVTKEASEKWLTRKGIRSATPEEVATHYGK